MDMGAEEIDIEGADSISKLREYIPPCQGKEKVPKDPDEGKFMLNTLLLPDQITFEGSCLVHIPALKLEDWELVDTERFSHLATNTFVTRVFYKESGVTMLE